MLHQLRKKESHRENKVGKMCMGICQTVLAKNFAIADFLIFSLFTFLGTSHPDLSAPWFVPSSILLPPPFFLARANFGGCKRKRKKEGTLPSFSHSLRFPRILSAQFGRKKRRRRRSGGRMATLIPRKKGGGRACVRKTNEKWRKSVSVLFFHPFFFSGFWLGWKEEEKMKAFFPKKGLPLQHKRHFFLRWEK